MFKKTVDKLLGKAVERVLDVLINWLEKALNADLDGDGDIGETDTKK